MGELINGRTPEEIKSWMRCCSVKASCYDCPYNQNDYCVSEAVLPNALAYIQHLESERDATLADMKGSRICALCAHWEAGINEPCMHCTFENNCFEWRGIKPKEDANGHQTD